MDILVTLKREQRFVKGRMHPFDREFFIVGEEATQRTVLKYVYQQIADFVAQPGSAPYPLDDLMQIRVILEEAP